MFESWQGDGATATAMMKQLIDSLFVERLSEECRHGILRYCVRICGAERRSMVELFVKNIEALSAEELGLRMDRACDVLYFLASDVDFGVGLLAECCDSVLNLYVRILSHFVRHPWVKRETSLRVAVLSLLAFVKHNWTVATKTAKGTAGAVARLVRRLMMRPHLPTNVTLDCGLIVVETDCRRNRLASSLWLLKNCGPNESVAFVALCYGAITVTSPRLFSKMIRHEENASHSQPLVSLSSIMRTSTSRKNDGRYLLAVLKFFEIFTRKICFADLTIDSYFFQHLVHFLWQHCDHFVDAIRALSRQCLKNAFLQSDPRVTREIEKILTNTDEPDERLCYVISFMELDDNLSYHCFQLVTRLSKQTSVPSSWMTKAYLTLLTNAYRGEFDFWFDRWIRPIWESSVERGLAFRRDVLVAALTVCPQSLEILIDTATEEQLSSILDFLLSIEDKEVRGKRINAVDPQILVGVASSNPLAVITFISARKDAKSCVESLRASVDAIFCCDRAYQRRTFVRKLKNITVDEDVATWIRGRCFSSLFAGASFDRRHCALLLLATLRQPLENCTPDHFCALFACLSDSYPENQTLAVQLLKPIAGYLRKGNQLRPIYSFVFEALFEANVSEHDTCAFVSQLLCHLPPCEFHLLSEYAPLFNVHLDLRTLAVGEGSSSFCTFVIFLLEIVKSRLKKFDSCPMYGVLRVIRHIVEHTPFDLCKSELLSELAETCVECNLQVLSVVTQSSPEGYLPANEFAELDESLLYANSQKALLRGWRTVKEVSLLLKHLLGAELLDENLMKFIGAHLKTLLFELKHKGAIEVVYMVASTFCCTCSRSTNEHLRDMPRRWLQEIVESIMSGNEGPICRWRRSAGLPFIVQAALSANSIQSDILCNEFAKQLLQIYEDGDAKEESKIHSANVLRILFKNRNLAQKVDNHVEMALKVAIDGVASSSWNMRNVSWLLLGSLIPRSCELNNGPNAISFFRQFPSLFDFFCRRLRGCDRSQLKNQSSVFSVLLLLASLQPCECDYSDGVRDSISTTLLPMVFECAASPIWKIRITAARAMRALITRDSYVFLLSGICANLKSPLEQNSLHGSLSQIEILLRLGWTTSAAAAEEEEEKCYLRKILTDLVADTNFLLNCDKNSVLVKRRIFILHTLVFKRLTEWRLDGDEAFGSSAAVRWPENSAATYLEDGTLVRSWMIHVVSRQLRATADSERLETLLRRCLLREPAVAVDILQAFLLPASCFPHADDEIALLRDYFLAANAAAVDRNRIICSVTRSQFVCPHLNTFVRDCVARKTYPFAAIRLLSYLAESQFFESLTVDEIESACSLVGDDEHAFSAIVRYVGRALKFLVNSPNNLLRIARSVCTLDTVVASNIREQQIMLYDEFLSRISASDDVSVVLDIWSQKLEFATREEPNSLDALLRNFHTYSDSLLRDPSICAVALIGWSLADIGILWDRIKSQGTQSAFGENLPARFENKILLSRACSKLLGELSHSHTRLAHLELNKGLTLWLFNRCQISPPENIFKLVDVVSFFVEMRANLAASSSENVASYLYHGTVFKRFAIDSIGLVISAFEK